MSGRSRDHQHQWSERPILMQRIAEMISRGRIAGRLATRKLTVAALVVAGIALIVGFLAMGHANSTSSGAKAKTVRMEASWAKGYSSLSALKADADLSIDGTVSNVIGVTKDSKNLVFTDYAVSIKAVVYDPNHRAPMSAIVVDQTGGIIGDSRFEVADDPLFQVGEHVILFLHEYSPGHFFVIGGPTGRFEVLGGYAHAMSPDGVKFTNPVTEAEFVASSR
jgi:hypothetical protein